MGDNGNSDWGKLRVYQVHYYVLQEPTVRRTRYEPDNIYAELTDFVVARDEDEAMRKFDRQIRPEIRLSLQERAEVVSKATFATEVEVPGYGIKVEKVEEKQKSKTQKPSRLEQSLMDGIEKVE